MLRSMAERPRRADAPRGDAASDQRAKPVVLVVEDEPALLTLLKYNLEAEGYRVVEATNGEDALVKAREETPDLILLDWMLPLVSGIEVCRQIRRTPDLKAPPSSC